MKETKTKPFPDNGPAETALSYAGMRRKRAFTNLDLYKCFHNRFRKPSEALNALVILQKHGFVQAIDEFWAITESGQAYLRNNAREFFRKNS